MITRIASYRVLAATAPLALRCLAASAVHSESGGDGQGDEGESDTWSDANTPPLPNWSSLWPV